LTIYVPYSEEEPPVATTLAEAKKLDTTVSGAVYVGETDSFRYYQSSWFSLAESIIASIGVIFLLPVFFIVAVLIKLEGAGPIFFKQQRLGKDEKSFDILKFRTMRVDAEKDGPFICKSYSDERITPLGKFLRKTKLDELPQLINVIKNEMSLVGPRPERPHFHKKNQWIPNWNKRLEVKPGITGLAQISKFISHNPEQKIHADLFYSSNRTLKSDTLLVLMTVLPWLKEEKFFGIRLK